MFSSGAVLKASGKRAPEVALLDPKPSDLSISRLKRGGGGGGSRNQLFRRITNLILVPGGGRGWGLEIIYLGG